MLEISRSDENWQLVMINYAVVVKKRTILSAQLSVPCKIYSSSFLDIHLSADGLFRTKISHMIDHTMQSTPV